MTERERAMQVITRIVLKGGRDNWLDPEDAREIARDIYDAGYRPLMGQVPVIPPAPPYPEVKR
jgi:hypothetical protein